MVKRNLVASLLFYLLSLTMLHAPCNAAAVPPQDILVVHSYHQGFLWTDNVMAGILDVLQKEASGAQIHVEYMDAKRYPPEIFGPILIETLIRKTSRLKPKVILVSDDAAFDLILRLRKELFPGVPLVFCGVNNFKDERLAGQNEVTGVVEDFDIKSTIDVILSLHKQATHLAVISDSTETGMANRERFRHVAPVFADRLKFLELYDLSTEELIDKLAKLPSDTIILNLSFFRDKLGQSYSTQDGNKLIAAHAERAIYSCWDFFLVGDVVGGYVTSGRQQGEKAASMASAILKGIRANDIPIIRTSPNAYMFDYDVMERFGIKKSALPQESVVINRQISTLEQYWGWILSMALFCGLQTFLILALLTRGKRLHAANAALGKSEHFTRSLLEAIPVPVFYKGRDGRYQGFNKAFLNFYGKSKNELIGKSVFDIASPDTAKVHHSNDLELYEKQGSQIYPYTFKTSHGDFRDVIFHKASLTDEQGSVTGLIGAILDVTEQKQVAIALQESELRFKNLHNASFGGIAIHDKGIILDCNQGLSAISGYSYEELIGMNGLLLIASHSREQVMANISSGYEKPYEVCGQRKNGELYPLRLEARNIPYQGRAMRVVEFRDITESKRAEDALRESEERFLLAMKASNDGLFDWNLETNEIYYSPAWKKMIGYEDHELPNDLSIWKNYTHPDDVNKSLEMQQKLISKQIDRFILEFKMKHKNGHWVDILSRAEAIFNDSGQAVRIVGTHTDITERMQAEEQLRKSEEQFRNLYDEAPVGYFEYNLQGNITRVNQRYLKMLSYPAEEIIGQPCWKFIVDEFAREQIMAKLEGVRAPAVSLERTYRRKDGTTFPVLFEDSLLLDGDGHIKGIRTAIQDITERKQADKEKEKLQAQLNQAQKMESVGRLAGGVAHDFNNMLGVILGHTEMALEETDPASSLYADLNSVHYAAERSAALTRQLLAFARKQTVVPKVIDLNETLEGMLKMLRQLIGEDITLIWRPGLNLNPVKIDPAQIDQLLANLCVNARDAIAGQGKITIETSAKTFNKAYCADRLGLLPGEYILLEVNDNGCGMDKKTLSQIFEPFFTTKEHGKGTGLGLASIYGMVKQNNGFINVCSEPTQGTTFKIYFPIYAAKPDEVVDKAPDLHAEHGNETILLVEDETAILEMTTRMLERLDYNVVPAATPGEAIRLAHEYQGQIDLLMTDVVMPEMNGRELADKLLSQYPALKRLFMSGYTANVIAHHGVLDEGVYFIQKPFSKKDLGGKLLEALEG